MPEFDRRSNQERDAIFLAGALDPEIKILGFIYDNVKFAADSDKEAYVRIPLDQLKHISSEGFEFVLQPIAEDWHVDLELCKTSKRPHLKISVAWPQAVFPDTYNIQERANRLIGAINAIYEIVRKDNPTT